MRVGGPVEIARIIRRMRGRSQAFLLQGLDGCFYVAKFPGNPLGNRTLISEFLAAKLLIALGIKAPSVQILSFSGPCEGRDQLYFQTPDGPRAIIDGLAFGSRCPVDPAHDVIFDCLPRRLYSKVANLDEVGVVFAFDLWCGHADTRQFIFTRTSDNCSPAANRFSAWPIDNGSCFGGELRCGNQHSTDRSPSFSIYSHCDLAQTAVRGARLIESCPSSVIRSSSLGIPCEWFGKSDAAALATLLQALEERKTHLATEVDRAVALYASIQDRRIA